MQKIPEDVAAEGLSRLKSKLMHTNMEIVKLQEQLDQTTEENEQLNRSLTRIDSDWEYLFNIHNYNIKLIALTSFTLGISVGIMLSILI